MNRIKQLKETRGAKLKELNALQQAAEKRAFTKDEGEKFDALAAEIEQINADITREERAAGISAAAPVEERAVQDKDQSLGLSGKEVRNYSLLRAISCLARGEQPDGLEGEASAAEARRVGRDPSARGFFVPFEVMARGVQHQREERALTAGSASGGGYTIGTDIDYANMVELLRNQSVLIGAGARVLSGLKNDVSIPRVLTGATAYWVSETGTISQSNATFGQIAGKPRRLGASVPYSTQFLAQSGIGAEMFVRDDMMGAFAVELDRVGFNGSGVGEPLGIFGLASGDRATGVTFGAAPTWAKVVSFETNVGDANAGALPGSPYAYFTTPAVRGAWKTTAKISGQAQWLWEANNTVNGYAALATKNVPSDKVVYGQPSQVIYLEWTGIEIIVDPYTGARAGTVNVTMQKLVDMVIRQGKAFSVSSDAGNQ